MFSIGNIHTVVDGIRPIILVVIIFVGAFGLLHLREGVTRPLGQKQHSIRNFTWCLGIVIVLGIIMYFLST